MRLRSTLALSLAILGLAACSEDPVAPVEGQVPDFSLPDVNSTSPRFQEAVSPRDYEGKVSAWYFGHAT